MTHGIGVGLRACHYEWITRYQPDISWFEVLADNYFADGIDSYYLDIIAARYPLSLHCVGMSLGSSDPLNWEYLKQLKKLIKKYKPISVSDHLCWTSLQGQYFHELLPLPYTSDVVHHVVQRIKQIQDFLEVHLMIENVSTYLNYTISDLHEWDFLQTIADVADAWILLDINNIVVSAHNNHFDPYAYLQGLTTTRIKQFHLAGFEIKQGYLLDTHGHVVDNSVWELYQKALKKWGKLPTIIEWDNNIPTFEVLSQEVIKAQAIYDRMD